MIDSFSEITSERTAEELGVAVDCRTGLEGLLVLEHESGCLLLSLVFIVHPRVPA